MASYPGVWPPDNSGPKEFQSATPKMLTIVIDGTSQVEIYRCARGHPHVQGIEQHQEAEGRQELCFSSSQSCDCPAPWGGSCGRARARHAATLPCRNAQLYASYSADASAPLPTMPVGAYLLFGTRECSVRVRCDPRAVAAIPGDIPSARTAQSCSKRTLRRAQ